MAENPPYDPRVTVAAIYGTAPFDGREWPEPTTGAGAKILPIDMPPPYAASAEIRVIEALDKLTPEEARRVLRWAASRFGYSEPTAKEVKK